ncbi:MAG: iron-containing alcohol dehydrogenase [Candidatus Njordarchaeia archaeon]
MPILSLPRMIFMGEGALDEFKEFLVDSGIDSALIVTDKIIKDIGLTKPVIEILEKMNIQYQIFDRVKPEPSFETVEEGGKFAQEVKPQAIIAIGGGSVIDAAKSIWVKYEKPDFNLEELSPFVWLGLGKKCILIAIPTTSGTGSEHTIGVVLSKKKENKKIALGSYEVVPYYTIVDPHFAMSMPQKLTAATGIDALTHSVEAYVSNVSNPFTDALAEKSIELIFSWLPKAYIDGSNRRAREKMHIAASLAGIAFSNSGLGIAHALGHSFGPIFDIPHGFAVGVFLPYVVAFNASKSEEAKTRYALLGKIIGVNGNLIDELYKGFLDEIGKLYERINAPSKIIDLGIDEDEYFSKIDLLVQNAYEDPDLAFNPVMVTPDDLKEILEMAFDGTKFGRPSA